MGKVMHIWGQVGYGKSLYVPFNFSVNIKWLRKANCIVKMGGNYAGDAHTEYRKPFKPSPSKRINSNADLDNP